MNLFEIVGTIAVDNTKANKQINSVSEEAKKIGQGFKDSNIQSGKSLSEIAEANGKTVNEIRSEVSKVAAEYRKQGMDASEAMRKAYADIGYESKSTTDKIKNDANGAGNEASEAFKKIGSAAGDIAKGVGIIGTIVGGAFIAATEATREYRQDMGKLESSFLTTGQSAETAKKTYQELNGVLGDSGQAVEASQHLAKITDNEKELQMWTDICTGVYSEFGASLPTESLTESALEVQKNGQLTGGLVDALVWAGISEEEFQAKLDACSSEQERQDLIMNTLNDTYKAASDQYKETNKDVIEANKANDNLTNAFAKLGETFEPIMTSIKNKVAEAMDSAVPKIESFIEKIKDCANWVKDNEDKIKTWAAVIIGATVSVGAFLLILNWGSIVAAATKAIQGATAAVKLFNTALKSNPIGLVVSLIAGLVAAFIYLWNNNEGFRKFWLDLWDKIKTKCGDAIDWIKTKFDKFKEMLSTVKQVFGGIKDTITEKIESAKKVVETAVDKIKGFFPLSIGKIFSNLKIPSITVSGGKAPYGIAGKGKLPSFDVNWNAKGAIFNQPTVLPTIEGLQGFGESGAEAVIPLDSLYDRIDMILIKMDALMDRSIFLDTGLLVGEMAPSMNAELGNLYNYSKRHSKG